MHPAPNCDDVSIDSEIKGRLERVVPKEQAVGSSKQAIAHALKELADRKP